MAHSSPAGPHLLDESALSIALRVEVWDRVFDRIRSTLRAAGLREVSTPILRAAPSGLEGECRPLLAPPGYLAGRAGPAMRRLICQGSGPIFQISHVFAAAAEASERREESQLVEWYRSGGDIETMQRDVVALVFACFAAAERPGPARWQAIPLLDLVHDTLGLRLSGDESAEELQHKLAALPASRGLFPAVPEGPPSVARTRATWRAFLTTWSERHGKPWSRAQGELGVHLKDLPGALFATGDNGADQPARGFVSFYAGVECGGGRVEPSRPETELENMQLENQIRELRGLLPLPLDHALLATLRDPGQPPCVGAVLHLDHTLALACGASEPAAISTLVEPVSWVAPRSAGLSRAGQLVAEGLVNEADLPDLREVEARLAVAISPTMRSLVRRRDDAIARQFVPDVRELRIAGEERSDPIGDAVHAVQPGLIHRYHDRALLKPTHLCSVYCRFCFRRDVVGDPASATLAPSALAAAIATISERPQIWEVILTGGDPLVLAASRIASLLSALRAIPHVRIIRIHSRVPLVAPERITPSLIRALRGPKPAYVVLHTNHASEFTPAGAAACAALVDAGIPMLSQTVLLRGVNDTPFALESLLRTLVSHRIKPYYLHHPDLVEGTSHLRVSLAEGRALIASLRGRLSGLCQPVYVLDIPGGFGKVPAGQAFVEGPLPDGSFRVTDPSGTVHSYREPSATGSRPTPGSHDARPRKDDAA